MKKLVLAGVMAMTAIFSTPTKAQVFVNVNIGSRPQYAPVRYVNTGYYYSAPSRPVYVNNVYKVKYKKNNNWRPVSRHYVSRPSNYKRTSYKYKGHSNNGHSYYKVKSHKHDRGHGKSRGRR